MISKDEARFLRFDQANPHIYEKLVSMTHEAQARGIRRVAMNMLVGVLRWNNMISTDRVDRFKISQNYCGYYTRKMAREFPDLGEMFGYRLGKHVGRAPV
jgi:hypothetical protein